MVFVYRVVNRVPPEMNPCPYCPLTGERAEVKYKSSWDPADPFAKQLAEAAIIIVTEEVTLRSNDLGH